MTTQPRCPLPAPLGAISSLRLEPEVSEEDRRAIARYEALSTAERMRCCNLVALARCDLTLAVAAIEALRPRKD